MKRLLLSLCALLNFSVSAQTNFKYDLAVVDTKGAPKSNLSVVFIEKNNFERLERKTDAGGKLSLTFDHGREWSVSVGEMIDYTEVTTLGTGMGNELITYDLVKYERKKRLLPDRRTIQFQAIAQSYAVTPDPTETASVVKIVLENKQKTVFPNVPVKLTCFATKQQFSGRTNTKGEAIFLVPAKNDYEVDVDDINSLRYVDLDGQPKIKTMTILYEKKQFTEKTTDGYTEQTFKPSITASSSHAKVQLSILKGGSAVANEPVYLRAVKSATMYKGKTDAAGTVIFMLPIKGKYLIDFTFQRDAGVVDLSRFEGIANQSMTVNYIPDPRLEHAENLIPRVESLIAYDISSFLNKQYPDPQGDVELFMEWGNKFNESSKEAVLEIGFKVNARRAVKEAPKNLVFVVDVSGSMAGEDRLEQVKTNLIAVVNNCNPTDKIALIVFDDQAQVAFPGQLMSNKKALTDVLAILQPGGGTNIYKGLELGLAELMKAKTPGMVNRLILLTDGYCSVEPEITIAKAKEYIAKGVQISTIGVGTSYNQALLSQLASAGGGQMEMAGNPQQISKAFEKTLGSLITPVGQNVRLEMLYNDKIVYRQLFGYANEKVAPGKMTVKFDHLFPGLEKMGLVKFDIINSNREIEKMPVTARLIYTDVATKKEKVVEKTLHPEWTTATGAMDISLDRDHKLVLAIAIANQSIKNMADSFQSGNKAGAEKAIKSGVEQIKKLFPGADPQEIEGLMKQLREYTDVFAQLKELKVH